MQYSLKDASFLCLGGGVANHHRSWEDELSSLFQTVEHSEVHARHWSPHSILLDVSNLPDQAETSSSLSYDGFAIPKYVSSLGAQVASNSYSPSISVPSQYLYPSNNWLNYGTGISWTSDPTAFTGSDFFVPSSQPFPVYNGVLFSGYPSHPWIPSHIHPMNATTTPSVPPPLPAETSRQGTTHTGAWGYQLTPSPAPFSSQAAYRPMDAPTLPLTAAPTYDPAGWWEPFQELAREIPYMPPTFSSPSTSSLSGNESLSHAPSVTSAPTSSASETAPLAGHTAVMIRKREGSYLKPTIGDEIQGWEYCRWDDCGELIACDRSSVNDHMRQHIRDLHAQGSLFSGDRPFKGPIKSRPMSKCQTHCRWRGDVPCRYSDKYESKTHETMLRKKRRRMQKSFGRGVKRSDWGRNVHVRHSDTPSDDDSDCEIEMMKAPGRSREDVGHGNGSLISVQSLIKHICATHLLSLMMTCGDCNERFSRTDAYGRHRKEVHDGKPRGRNH